MEERAFDWKAADGTYIYAWEWQAEQARAVICLAHGLGEHVGRYEAFAEWFVERGITVIGYDRRGHGKSAGKRGHSMGVEPLLDEVARLLVEAETRYQKLPIFLYGHSQGGSLVLSYALHRHPNLSGIIASAPWISLAFEPPAPLIALGKLMRRIYPAFQQSNNLNTADLSRDPEVVEAYEADPLVHDRITAGNAINMMEEGAWLLRQRGDFPCPLLVLHGTGDKVTSAEASETFVSHL
ncbi:MAG TPA: lysophospholipase, partial [Phaeodactylibacter sp.]|nr:lysophospholipase [Phaeodactylibacter sp.]